MPQAAGRGPQSSGLIDTRGYCRCAASREAAPTDFIGESEFVLEKWRYWTTLPARSFFELLQSGLATPIAFDDDTDAKKPRRGAPPGRKPWVSF